MEKISTVIEKLKALAPNANWDAKFIDHGLGYLTEEDHAHLLEIGAITCDGLTDAVRCDYAKLVITKTNGEESVVDKNGHMLDLRKAEQDAKDNGLNAKIVFYPRAYANFLEKKRITEQESIKSLLQTFDGELA